MKPDPSHFSLWHDVPVRFKDIDVGGHAHHSAALVFFEEARARYWSDVAGKGGPEDVEFILAEARVRYHARIFYPGTVGVGVRVSKLGKKHFVMEYLARDSQGDSLVSGETTMVMFDYGTGRSKPVSPDIRQRILAHEGALLD